MEFAIVNSEEKLRLGKLTLTKNDRELSLATPACLLYTRSGCVPHLTHDALRLSIFRETVGRESSDDAKEDGKNEGKDRLLLPLLFPMAAFLPHRKSLDSFSSSSRTKGKGGVVDFVGVSRDFDAMTFTTQHDPAAPLPTGFNAGPSVSLWNYAGRADVTPAIAAEMASAMAPDVAQVLADVDVGFHPKETDGTSKKRQVKAVNRSRAFFPRHVETPPKEEAREKEEKTEMAAATTSKTSYWATVIVGLEEKHLQRYLQELSECPYAVRGYVLDGLQPAKNLRDVVESSPHVQRVVEAVSNVVSALSPSKPRLLPHVATPQLVVEGVEAGVDLFDTSFAVVAADRGGALVFDCETGKGREEADLGDADSSSSSSRRVVEINLSRTEFAGDFSPLLPGCACYACATHTKAYVHHLLVTQELLAQVLLMVHNQYHYIKFFHRLRRAIETGKWDQFKKSVLNCRHEVAVVDEKSDGKRTEEDDDVGDEGKRKRKLVL